MEERRPPEEGTKPFRLILSADDISNDISLSPDIAMREEAALECDTMRNGKEMRAYLKKKSQPES